MGEPDVPERVAPEGEARCGDLLKGDDVRLALRERGGLLGEDRDAAGDVPGDDARQAGYRNERPSPRYVGT